MTVRHALIAATTILAPPALYVGALWVAHWADIRNGWYRR